MTEFNRQPESVFALPDFFIRAALFICPAVGLFCSRRVSLGNRTGSPRLRAGKGGFRDRNCDQRLRVRGQRRNALFMQRFFRHREEGEKKKDETARRENILILKSVSVIGKLTMANAIAIRDGRTNGELHAALEDYDKVNRELYDYLLEQNANK